MTVYGEEHNALRSLFREILEQDASPHLAEWEQQGYVSRAFYKKLADAGIMGHHIPHEYGGGGETSFLYNAALVEEATSFGISLGSLRVHMAVVVPYILKYGTAEQKERWLPPIASGQILTSIGITEPAAGSDLAAMRTRARRDGDHYVLDGSKIFITGGAQADLVLIAARTGALDDRRNGISLLLLDMSLAGVERGPLQRKIGLQLQDTVELYFTDVRVPRDALLGAEGEGLSMLKSNLSQERLIIGIGAIAGAERALALTTEYVKERALFGKRLADLQNTRFQLAEAATEIAAGRALLNQALLQHDRGELSVVDAAQVKLYATELQSRVSDRCLQLFGGYGYMQEYPISKLYTDARVARIYGGSSEVMKAIIGSALVTR